MSIEERTQTETVNHGTRVAALFAVFVWAVFSAACWLTGTKRGWIVLLIAIACGVVLRAALR